MNKTTVALTSEQYAEIITTMKQGFTGCRPNVRVATALMLEANLGLRVSDVLELKLTSFIKDGNRYRLDAIEQKTSKTRTFTVPTDIYNFVSQYCIDNSIKSTELIFPISERAIQKQLKIVCDFLEIENISTHSFRKFFATQIYINSDYNISLVQQLLQHTSPATTQKYIGIQQKEVEQALQNHIHLL